MGTRTRTQRGRGQRAVCGCARCGRACSVRVWTQRRTRRHPLPGARSTWALRSPRRAILRTTWRCWEYPPYPPCTGLGMPGELHVSLPPALVRPQSSGSAGAASHSHRCRPAAHSGRTSRTTTRAGWMPTDVSSRLGTRTTSIQVIHVSYWSKQTQTFWGCKSKRLRTDASH
jgi:hypothetical protein